MIPARVRKEVTLRSGDRCEGIYIRTTDGAEHIGPCPCRGRFQLVMAHITHRGMGGVKSRDRADNILHLCPFSHDLFDQRITRREFDRLMKGG